MRKYISTLFIAALLSGCAASSEVVKTVVLPTSNKSIDVVQHRSDVKLADCATLVVLQTYDAEGKLIDSKEGRGNAIHCDLGVAFINAGATVGAANQIRRGIAAGRDVINNSNEQAQGQGQLQGQIQEQDITNTNVNVNKNVNRNTTRVNTKINNAVSGGGSGEGGSHGHGNNGYGNGGNDGSPNDRDDSHR